MKEQKEKIEDIFLLYNKGEPIKRPYLIAEVGVNYYEIAQRDGISLLEAALKMIEEASRAGADAVKFQAYKADKLASRVAEAYWNTNKESTLSQYCLFKRYDKLDYSDYRLLSDKCKQEKIEFLCTCFDEEGLSVIAPLVPAIKIASSDITNFPLMRAIANYKKPVLLSTGASKMSEIFRAVEYFFEEGCTSICLLHCVLSYPTKFKDANLAAIKYLRKAFPECMVGYSDHCVPDSKMLVLTLAFLYGAVVLEKHFTLDKSLQGNDHYHSMDPLDIEELWKNIDFINEVTGKEKKDLEECEKIAHAYARRSIVANKNIFKGERIEEQSLSIKRPGTGLSPDLWSTVIGRLAKRNIKKDEPITWDDIL